MKGRVICTDETRKLRTTWEARRIETVRLRRPSLCCRIEISVAAEGSGFARLHLCNWNRDVELRQFCLVGS